MKTPKTFKELFTNTGIKPTTDESGNIHYNFKATKKKKTIEEAVIGLAQLLKDDPKFFIQEPKQETLEEAGEKHLQEWRLLNNIHLSNPIHAERCKNDFIAGVKWQQERSYSEEEVINIIKEFDNKNNLRGNINNWFEQFKKK